MQTYCGASWQCVATTDMNHPGPEPLLRVTEAFAKGNAPNELCRSRIVPLRCRYLKHFQAG